MSTALNTKSKFTLQTQSISKFILLTLRQNKPQAALLSTGSHSLRTAGASRLPALTKNQPPEDSAEAKSWPRRGRFCSDSSSVWMKSEDAERQTMPGRFSAV